MNKESRWYLFAPGSPVEIPWVYPISRTDNNLLELKKFQEEEDPGRCRHHYDEFDTIFSNGRPTSKMNSW